MGVLIGKNTRLLVQGLGRDGTFQAERMLEYGTNLVAAVHPGRSGKVFAERTPYFETVEEALDQTQANTGIIFVPALAAMDAIVEQVDAGLELVVCITEGIPVRDMVKIKHYIGGKRGRQGNLIRLVGPNCPGLISPASRCKVGIVPSSIVSPGKIGVVSRSGTLTYEAIAQLRQEGYGQSTCVGIGGDAVSGTSFNDVLELFQADPETEAVVLIGEIGGTREQQAAKYIAEQMDKPVIAYVAGRTAPTGKRMGHAGAIVDGQSGTAEAKIDAFAKAGVGIAETPALIGVKTKELVG